ncbi:hypothetical protein QA645_25260 [Bradyrhizobium sp. CIAT3101]|uniref:hypothetical protein n=1 Tax=Bradyrhizobium sp. CIAT3101 TaxID=439387 RepID=UPI0024B158D8|nr:hypothetical protein [Bradyrhizobium sp. CIAT3101]WFU77854.1 hypothetical protein QA645_25260 [Bradyrhizobium sp. CIAT3101]
MTLLRQHLGRMGLAAPKSTAWQLTFVPASLPLLLTVGSTLIAWLVGASPDFLLAAGGLAAWVLIFLPTWIALFINHRRVHYIFMVNFLSVLVSALCFLADMSVLNWPGSDDYFWLAFLEWLIMLIWSFIDRKRPAAPELDGSASPASTLTPIGT